MPCQPHKLIKTSGGTTFYMPKPAKLPDGGAACEPARTALGQLALALAAAIDGRPSLPISVLHLDDANRRVVDEVLGEGEVSVIIADAEDYQIQEPVLPGVWRTQRRGPDDARVHDSVDAGAVPAQVLAIIAERTHAALDPEKAAAGSSASLRPLLAEIAFHIQSYSEIGAAHVINFSNLPVPPDDLVALSRILGQGPVRAMSRGYSYSRVQSTTYRNVWWVQHHNSDGKLLLNTLEITSWPTAMAAPAEDLQDSLDRLPGLIEGYAK